jgi:hypothetical protein
MKTVITSDRKAVILNDDGTWKYAAPTGNMMEKLNAVSIPAGIIEGVKGMFGKLGIRVIDTGEAFTIIHRGDRVEFAPGVSAGSVDILVEVYAFQLERLIQEIRKGSLDELEQFRIARTVFAGAAGKRHMMSNPLMSNSILRRAIRGKNLMHVHLLSPDPVQEPDATYTILFVNNSMMAVPGLHGEPQRVLRVPLAEAIALQKNLFGGMKTGDITKWLKIAKWYVDWRKRVEVPL